MSKLNLLLKILKQEIFEQKKIFFIFCLNLILGFTGFLFLQIFQDSLSFQTQSKAKDLLGADFSLSARKVITADELNQVEDILKDSFVSKSHSIEMFAMIKINDKSRLIRIKAIDHFYPIYGQLNFKLNNSDITKEIKENEIYFDAELFQQFQLNLLKDQNIEVNLGGQQFKLSGELNEDSSRGLGFSGLAPFAYIRLTDLKRTQLIQEGSTLTSIYYYKFKEGVLYNEIKNKLNDKILDPVLQLNFLDDEEGQNNQTLKYFNDYLGLVSLVAIGLSLLGLVYLLNWLYQKQKHTLAVYNLLGIQSGDLIVLQILKVLLASLVSFGMTLTLLLIVNSKIEQFIFNNFNFNLKLNYNSINYLKIFIVLFIGPQVMSLLNYFEVKNIHPLQFLREQLNEKRQSRFIYFSWMILVLIFSIGLSVWQSHSLKTGSLFVIAILIISLFAQVVLKLVLKSLDYFVLKLTFENKYAALGLIRKSNSTHLIFLTMTLSVVVLTLLPHIKKSILNEIKPSEEQKIPSLFLFDIQPEQIISLKNIFNQNNINWNEPTPLVRSKIMSVNDVKYERDASQNSKIKTREEEAEIRFRNRGVNLTYKEKLNESEEILDGKWFTHKYDETSQQLPEVSLEEKYATRMKIKLNDIMEFDVQGLNIKAKVTSLRKVRWTSFQPNFFIVFQPGVLEEAPQNYVMGANIKQNDIIEKLQTEVTEELPNISIIDVRKTVEKALGFINQMSLALQMMAILSLVVGLFIFIILVNTQMQERIKEMNLLQILGATYQQINSIMFKQFLFVIFLALFWGVLLSGLMSYIMISQMFNLNMSFDYVTVAITLLLIIPLVIIIINLSLRPIKKINPIDLLK